MALGAWCSWGKKQITVSGEQKHCEPKSVNVYFGFFFLVNLCLGIGFLAFPYSFLHAGYLVAIPTLLLIIFVTWIHASWLLEVMARAQVRWELVVCCCFFVKRSYTVVGSDSVTMSRCTRSSTASDCFQCPCVMLKVIRAAGFG